MATAEPTGWEAILAAASPLWNLLSALAGGLIGAIAGRWAEAARAAHAARREDLALKRTAYLEFLSAAEAVLAASARIDAAIERDQANLQAAADDKAQRLRAFEHAHLALRFYAPVRITQLADSLAIILSAFESDPPVDEDLRALLLDLTVKMGREAATGATLPRALPLRFEGSGRLRPVDPGDA